MRHLDLVLACFLIALSSCKSGSTTLSGDLSCLLSASPTALVTGQSTQLTLSVTGKADNILLDGQAVTEGTTSVTPAATHTYVATVSNAAGSETCQAVVTVTPPALKLASTDSELEPVECSPPVSATLIDGSGNAVVAAQGRTVTLSSNKAGTKYFAATDGTCRTSQSASSFTIPAGSSSVSFRFSVPSLGAFTLSADAGAGTTGSSDWTAAVHTWQAPESAAVMKLRANFDGVYVLSQPAGAGAAYTIQKLAKKTGAQLWKVSLDLLDSPRDIAVDDTGIYVGSQGKTVNSSGTTLDYFWAMEKRSLADGSVVWRQTYNSYQGAIYDEGPVAVAVDPSTAYFLGSEFYNSGITGVLRDYADRRLSKTDGSLIGTQGLTTNAEIAVSVAVDATGVYYVIWNGTTTYNIVKRSFSGTNIYWSVNPGYVINDVALSPAGFFSIGTKYDSGTGKYTYHLEQYGLADGALGPSDTFVGNAQPALYVGADDTTVFASTTTGWTLRAQSVTDFSQAWEVTSAQEPHGTSLLLAYGGSLYAVAAYPPNFNTMGVQKRNKFTGTF